jgi:23S rRNA (cytosine1962-C5)-methyltransferase
MLANRLQKRQRHLRKWAKTHAITCYRIYERDIPEYPAIVDWYDGEAVVWLYGRKTPTTPAEEEAWQNHTIAEICAGLELPPEKLFIKERFRQKGLDVQYERIAQTQAIRIITEQELRFEINLSDYLDTGLFLDHRQTREMVRQQAADKRVLNLFAYTGSFTVYAINGRARTTTTVDISQTYCQWAARNLAHNGAHPSTKNRIIQQDCLQYLAQAAQQKEQYDLIICDPPTFSNSKRMKQGSFAIDRDYPDLLRRCAHLLTPGGALYFSTNSRGFRLNPAELPRQLSGSEITSQTVPEDFRNKQIHRCWLFHKTDNQQPITDNR